MSNKLLLYHTIHYQLIRVINGNTNCISPPVNVNNSILEKVATHSFIGCKYMLRMPLLNHIRTPAL